MKLIGIDLDGTLLNSNQEISAKNIDAIKKISKTTLPFICTGREVSDVHNILQETNLSIVVVGLNGAIGYYEQEKLFEFSFSSKSIRNIASLVQDYPTKIYSNKGSYESSNYIQSLTSIFNRVGSEFSPNELEYELDYEKSIVSIPFESIEEILEKDDLKIYKFFIFIPNKNLKRTLMDKLKSISNINVTESSDVNIEIIPGEVSKGEAFRLLEEIYELENTTRYAIGDSLNDLTLFKASHISFAMENGHPSIKDIATYITSSNDEDGVADALNIIENDL